MHPNTASPTSTPSADRRHRVILFSAKDPQQPAFEIRVRAAKLEPDMFYANRCMPSIKDRLFG